MPSYERVRGACERKREERAKGETGDINLREKMEGGVLVSIKKKLHLCAHYWFLIRYIGFQ
jgi:hypothetical protein